MMRLTVLGASAACQNPGGACAGYLLEQDDAALLIDCGSGVFGRLQRYVAPERVQAIVISHMHADHTLDLLPYRYYLAFSSALGRDYRPPHLFLPPGGHERLLGVSSLQDQSATFFGDLFSVEEYDPAAPLRVGPLSIAFVPVVHIPHTYGMRIQGQALVAYSADSGPCDGLHTIARQSDLFLCECANPEGSDYPLHLTPRQAGAIARQGAARRLLLTHRWWTYGEEETVSQARQEYDGPAEIAREDAQVMLAP
jgi:ribonuclease BN (tRNA processing enzyme)